MAMTAPREDAALVHDRHAFTQSLGLVHVTRRVDNRATFALEIFNAREEVIARLRIDADGPLVEQNHLRTVDDRAGEAQSLLHPAGVCVHPSAPPFSQADELQRVIDALPKLASAQAVQRFIAAAGARRRARAGRARVSPAA
jgi:hypothetical protein